ncbi:glycosyltransferase [Pedobacter sandarakinus]|uniref:glycosyltransferase n=1 Tax=Pedobacter sandarakinus TaxID=353156 RepID=UPI0022456841|nr:glycosyltransferase [Pedobacter sandarakinus]MCX2574306.1 glycosyltransferase [Pedobacter sandarakinus]
MDIDKSKMVFISLTDEPNGAENVLLMAATAADGDMIFLRKGKTNRLKIPANVSAQYLSDNSIPHGLMKLIPKLGKISSYEIIMSTHPYLNAILGMLKRMGYIRSKLIARECTSVFTRFSGIRKWTYAALYRIGYPGVNLVVCQTEAMKDQLLEHNSFIAAQKILVQPNPIDFSGVLARSNQQILNGDANVPFICAAGRLIPEKGFDILIDAFKQLSIKHPGLKLLILGDGKERDALMARIADNNLNDEVFLKGHIDNPVPYFKHAKLCVVSSIKEGFPNVLLEMMAVNSSVISTLCAGGIEEIPGIQKVPVNDVPKLALAMENAINHQSNNQGIIYEYLNARKPDLFCKAIVNTLIKN